MNILFFSRLFYPHIGGVETHVLEISKRLVKKGYTVTIITERFDSSDLKQNLFGITVLRIPVKKNEKLKKFDLWRWLWSNRKLIQKADVVHCHDVFFWYVPFRFLYPWKKVFTTFHGYETVFPPSQKVIVIRKISEVLSFGNICIGGYIKKWYHTKPTCITYGGVNKVQSPKSKGKSSYIKILLIGRLEKDIGIDIYIKIFQFLKKRNIRFKLQVLGDGTYRKQLEEFGKVLGFIKNTSRFIENSDMIFASSYLSILTGFAHKKQVVSVYQNELKKDYLMMTPFSKWILSSNTPEKLVNQIGQYRRNNQSYINISENAYKWATKHTWDHTVSLYLKLWQI